MSILGLDTPDIADAYESAQRESAGWLLLHYTSRDDVELQGHGFRGPSQLQSAISRHSDTAPLYAFVHYKQRKFVVKYIPDGTSRLVQARTTVHFQTILEHFSPYDAAVEASKLSDLNGSALSTLVDLPLDDSPSPTKEATPSLRMRPTSYIEPAAASTPTTQADANTRAEVSNILARLRAEREGTSPTLPPIPVIPPFEESRDSRSIKQSSSESYRTPVPTVSSPVWPQRQESYNYAPQSEDKLQSLRSGSTSGEHPRDETSHDDRPTTSTSTTYDAGGFKKPKLRFFTRTVSEAPTNEERERSKLPPGMRIRKPDSESREETRHSSNSLSRPTSSKDNRSMTSRRHAHSRSTDKRSLSSMDSGAPQSPQISSQTDIPPIPTSLTHNALSAYDMSSSQLLAEPRTLSQKTSQSSMKKAPMTMERQRLMKALEHRKRQQEQTAALNARNESMTSEVERVHAGMNESPLPPKADSGIMVDDRGATAQTAPQSFGPAERLPNTHIPASGEQGRVSPETFSTPTGDSFPDTAGTYFEPAKPNLVPNAEDSNQQSLAARSESLLPPIPERSAKRLTITSPIRNGRSKESGSNESSKGGSFSEELESATIAEAQTVVMAQTPKSATFGETYAQPKVESPPKAVRAEPALERAPISRHVSHRTASGGQGDMASAAARSQAPGSYYAGKTPSVSSMKRTNVSSGISSRIKALEERSQRADSPTSNQRTPANLEMPSSFTSPHLRTLSITSRPSSRGSALAGGGMSIRGFFRPLNPIEDVNAARSNRDSFAPTPPAPASTVSVTARIVRAARQRSPEKPSHKVAPEPEFQQSQVIVERQGPQQTDISSRHPAYQQQQNNVKRIDRPNSIISARPDSRGSAASGLARGSMDLGFKFMNRRRSDSKSPTLTENSPSAGGSLERVEEGAEEKKQSRTSRFFKRMSGLTGSSRRGASDVSDKSVHPLDSREVKTSHSTARVSKCIVGDLNVQFPDTLFWKRRWVEIDGSGNLTLSGSQRGEKSRVSPKKYHMSSFSHPVIPNSERQELPHSVILDFLNGGTLQLASDDRVSQTQMYRRLVDAYAAWTN